MNQDLYYLLNFLEDEFKAYSEVRLRTVSKSNTQKSIDLEQNYDPNSSNLHEESGVMVVTKRREYFFPTDWMSEPQRRQLLKQVQEVRDLLSDA